MKSSNLYNPEHEKQESVKPGTRFNGKNNVRFTFD
jgi:hypothetical protein